MINKYKKLSKILHLLQDRQQLLPPYKVYNSNQFPVKILCVGSLANQPAQLFRQAVTLLSLL